MRRSNLGGGGWVGRRRGGVCGRGGVGGWGEGRGVKLGWVEVGVVGWVR